MSHQEQSVRKNNIIIKGLETSDTTVTQDVKIMIERKLNSKLEKRIDEIERKNDERYEIVQRKMSHQEQSVRKNNIIIKGLETSDTTVTQDVKIMIERKLNLKTEIKEAIRLNTKGGKRKLY
ncbi:hypothetical protein QE152_g5263 [Popillia japonica]|uniref:Uncharacterized protein n=1 Tax=Popillia japonica TaxID=7064 RepID=A0AAW1MIJ3_POPJA